MREIAIRRRLRRVVVLFVLVQAVVAAAVSVRARMLARERAQRHVRPYASRSFDPVLLEHGDDEVRLYMRGEELVADLVAAIDGATSQILFETFIWCDDDVGVKVRDALSRAAGRGVSVRVLWDWLLSDRTLGDDWFAPPVEAHPFRPIAAGPSALRPTNLLRDHRKLVVVDERVAFVGGYNMGGEYIAWRDTHLRVEGTAVRELANAFVDFWNEHVPATAPRLANVHNRPWDPHVIVHRNDPSLGIFPIRGMYLEAIDRAEHRVWLTNAYFVPDRAFRQALVAAAGRGTDVRVMLPRRSNHALTDTLAHGMFDELLATGVRVFLYRDVMMHAKTALVDDAWVTVGTANLDRWSMLGNFELNLELRSRRLAAQMADMFELDLQQCEEVQLEAWRRRPLHWRAAERVLRSLAPLM